MNFRLGKQERSGNIQLLGDLFPAILKNFGLERAFNIESIRDAWPEIAGDVAAMSEPKEITDGILFITSRHPAISQEVIMMKSAIISRIAEKYGEELKDIRMVR